MALKSIARCLEIGAATSTMELDRRQLRVATGRPFRDYAPPAGGEQSGALGGSASTGSRSAEEALCDRTRRACSRDEKGRSSQQSFAARAACDLGLIRSAYTAGNRNGPRPVGTPASALVLHDVACSGDQEQEALSIEILSRAK